MKKKTEDLINEIIASKDISCYIDTNQEEFLEVSLHEHLQKLLLRVAHLPFLDARNRRDSIIIFAVNRRLAVPDTNDILYELGEACL